MFQLSEMGVHDFNHSEKVTLYLLSLLVLSFSLSLSDK